MRLSTYVLFVFLILFFSCKKDRNNSSEIKNKLKEAIETSNLEELETIISNNPNKLDSIMFKLNPLEYSIINDYYDSFNKLIELGADVNYIGNDKQSILLTSIRHYSNFDSWEIKIKYMQKLLENGANPNYSIKKGFVNKNGGYIIPISPICKASTLNLEMVKMLISYGANQIEPVGGITPFGFAIKARNFEIIHYYLDVLKIDLNQPVAILNVKPLNEIRTYYPKDYIKKYLNFTKDSPSYIKTNNLINKIDSIKR